MKYPNIEAERARMGLSAEQLAQALGVTRKTLYNWTEKGNIPQLKLEEMSALFSVSCDYLLGRTPPINQAKKGEQPWSESH